MSIKLHLLNADGQFDAGRARIEKCFSESVEIIRKYLPLPNVDVVLCVDPCSVIPGLGIGGFTPDENRIYMAVTRELSCEFEKNFLGLLGHELHHCARWSGPGYGQTLGEALISEGLACSFESELRGGDAPFYARALHGEQLKMAWYTASGELQSASYDHRAWFYGTSPTSIPKHAGYSLGFAIVSQCQARWNSVSASQLWGEPASSFYSVDSLIGGVF
jgi:hypothetical protein